MSKFGIKKYDGIDFEALLTEAQSRHKAMTDKVKECQYSESRLTEMHNAHNDWIDWCRRNLTDRGIHMTVKSATGEPSGLFVIAAGSDY